MVSILRSQMHIKVAQTHKHMSLHGAALIIALSHIMILVLSGFIVLPLFRALVPVTLSGPLSYWLHCICILLILWSDKDRRHAHSNKHELTRLGLMTTLTLNTHTQVIVIDNHSQKPFGQFHRRYHAMNTVPLNLSWWHTNQYTQSIILPQFNHTSDQLPPH